MFILKYKISSKTKLDIENIKFKIKRIIKEKGHEIISETETEILFTDTRVFVISGTQKLTIEEGKFTINDLGIEKEVVFTYSISLIANIILFCVFLIFGITSDLMVLILEFPLVFGTILSVNLDNSRCKKMLQEIIEVGMQSSTI